MKSRREWKRTTVMILTSVALMITALPVYAAAPDWGQIEGSQMDSPAPNLQKMQCAFDEENLYIHITGGKSETWDDLPRLYLNINQKPLDGSLKYLEIIGSVPREDGEVEVAVKDSNSQERVKGTLVRKNGINEIDITIPFVGLGYRGEDVSEVTVKGAIYANIKGGCEAVDIKEPVDPEQPPVDPEKKDIVVDGDFSDWGGYDLAYVNAKGMSMASMTCDGTNLYLRIVEDGSMDNRFQWNSGAITILSDMGKVLNLKTEVAGTGEDATLTFIGIEGAYGECGKSEGVYNWEMIIPLSEVWDGITHVSEISMALSTSQDKPIITIPNPSYVGEEGGDGGDGDLDVGTGMVIDGYYKDWDTIPHTDLTHGGNEKANNHIGAVTMEEDGIYVHYKLGKLYGKPIKLDYMEFMIDNEKYDLRVLPVDANGNIIKGNANLEEGIHTNFGVFISNNRDINNANVGGLVALTVYGNPRTEKTPGDEVEFSISYDKLEEITGLKPSEIRHIKIKNDSIGNQWITCAGTSSGPWLGIIISVAAAAGLYYILAGKKRRKEG